MSIRTAGDTMACGRVIYAVDVVVGEWQDDERSGHGILYEKDGSIIYDGTWRMVFWIVSEHV